MLAHQISKYGKTLIKVFVSGSGSQQSVLIKLVVNWAHCSWAEYCGVLNTHPRCEAAAAVSPLSPPEEELSASLWIYGRFIVLH